MNISAFANQNTYAHDGWSGHGPTRQRYRELKRLEADQRQAAFDTEVAKVMREQNCGPRDARYVVNSRRRHEHRTGKLTPITLSRTTR